jgi:trimethylamine:corrinoid methyltransferase-like protein
MGVSSERDIRRIHDGSLEILESSGVTFHGSSEATELFEKRGCPIDGFYIQGL